MNIVNFLNKKVEKEKWDKDYVVSFKEVKVIFKDVGVVNEKVVVI